MRSITVLRALARFASQPAVRRVPQMAVRNLSTSQYSSSSVTPLLAEALTEEIKAEQELEASNLGGAAAPSFPGFKVETKEAEVRLTKTHGNENILVWFNVNHSVDMDDDYEHEVQTDADPVPVALPPFTVEISKPGERLIFHLKLVENVDTVGEYDFCVEEFYIAPAGTEDAPDHVYASSGKYIDPKLHDLLFIRYLEERGFDVQFCKTLVSFATHYEHSQYVSLLNKIKQFVTK